MMNKEMKKVLTDKTRADYHRRDSVEVAAFHGHWIEMLSGGRVNNIFV